MSHKDYDKAGVWQVSAEPMRQWVGDGGGGRFRPVMAVAMDVRSMMCLAMELGQKDEPAIHVAPKVLAQAIAAAGMPRRLEVRDAELATVLGQRPELAGVEITVVARLPVVDAMLREMSREMPGRALPSLLKGRGMSVERLRAFAEAGALFHAAKPWRQLFDEDVIEVEAPAAPKGLRCASVLGAAGQVRGIGFFADMRQYQRMVDSAAPADDFIAGANWSLMFNDPDEMDAAELNLWQEHGLPVAADDSMPVLLRYGKTIGRPDGATLTFVEGLCRAIALSSETQIDSGRWEQTVQTVDGPMTYRLTIPHLLEPAAVDDMGPPSMEAAMRQLVRSLKPSDLAGTNLKRVRLKGGKALGLAPATSNRDRAFELCLKARQTRGRRELQLVREALQLDADCAEAYVILAQRESDPAAAESLYRTAIDAGRRTLGDAAFKDPQYPFWGVLESRPFMRAMLGLSECLAQQDRLEEVADVLREMLRLNPGDNQGVRYHYLPLLIELDRLDEADRFINSEPYCGDVCALWDYAATLIACKRRRLDEAAERLAKALARNPYVPDFLLNPETAPSPVSGGWSPGHPSEAAMIADLLGPVWAGDLAAAQWFAQQVTPPPKPSRRSRKHR